MTVVLVVLIGPHLQDIAVFMYNMTLHSNNQVTCISSITYYLLTAGIHSLWLFSSKLGGQALGGKVKPNIGVEEYRN